MLAECSLQSLLQHLHLLLLPVINQPSPEDSNDKGKSPAGAGQSPVTTALEDCKQVVGIEADDFDMLLSLLEALAAADAGSKAKSGFQVSSSTTCCCCCILGVLTRGCSSAC